MNVRLSKAKVNKLSGYSQEHIRRLRMARIAVSTFFFVNGVLTATLSARIPAVQVKLALTSGQLGLALLGCTVGGLVAMNIASRITRYFGSNVVTIVATLCACSALPLVAFASNLPLFILALACFGAGSGAMDVTTSMQGVVIESEYGRSIFNAFHACFSIGSLLGAFLGGILAALRVGPQAHFLIIVLVAGSATIWSGRFLWSSKPAQNVTRKYGRNTFSVYCSRELLLLGIIAFCALLSVGAMFDWSAVYLSGTIHTGAGLAAAGFTTFLLCMTIGRTVGDYLAMRFGVAVLVRSACLLAATGLTLALIFTWMPAVFVGLGLVGIGLSVPFPLVLSATGRISKQRNNDSILAMVTTCGYFGMLAGPPAIGFIADRTGLRIALILVVCLCMLAALCAPAVSAATIKEDIDSLK